MKEQPEIETLSSAKASEGKKEKRLKYEIELEQRPQPLEGEAFDVWLKRIGGPNVRLMESFKEYQAPKDKAKEPLLINVEADFILNDKNLGTYFDKTKIDAELEKRNPNITFIKERGEYWFKKELFKNPELYFYVIGEALKNKRKIVANKEFGVSFEKWIEESKGEKVEETVEKKEEKPKKKKPSFAKATEGKEKKPEAKPEKKEPTLDEQIATKQKEIEEIERGYNIYYSPVVQDLLGLYYKDRLKDIKGLKKELKGMEKEKKKPSSAKATEGKKPKGMPEEPEQLLTAKEYLDHIRGTDKLFTEMALIRGRVKRKELKPEEYEKAKAKWQAAYSGTLAMNEMLSPRELEKISKILEKERAKAKKVGLLRKIWSFFKLVAKKFGKEVIEEVKRDALEKQLEVVKQRIKQGGVLGRSILEKEQKRLEKKLKKLRK